MRLPGLCDVVVITHITDELALTQRCEAIIYLFFKPK